MKTWQLLTLVGATLVGAILLNLFLLVAGGQPVGENVLEPGFDDNYVMETLRGRWEDIVMALSIAGVIAIFLALRLVAFLEGFADAPTVVDDDRPDAALLALWKKSGSRSWTKSGRIRLRSFFNDYWINYHAGN